MEKLSEKTLQGASRSPSPEAFVMAKKFIQALRDLLQILISILVEVGKAERRSWKLLLEFGSPGAAWERNFH